MSHIGPDTLSLVSRSLVVCSQILGDIRDIRLWFNRRSPPEVAPEVLRPYTVGKHFLSTKQAPSALSLKSAGSASVGRERQTLRENSFPLSQPEEGAANPSSSYLLDDRLGGDSVSSLVSRSESSYDQPLYDESYDSPEVHEPASQDISPLLQEGELPPASKRLVRVKYEDPWMIHAALVWSEARGNTLPTIISWNGDGLRIQDMLSPYLFGKNFASQVRNKIRFWDVQDHVAKAYFLRVHTHWGRALWTYAADKESVYHSFSVNLKRRILSLLSGKPDPLVPKGLREQVLADPEGLRSKKSRALRFIELLKTVDGIFLQRFLAYPEEVWTWKKYDHFILQGISLLIGDEFLDGGLTEIGIKLTTSYTQLKRCRKTFKLHAHRGTLNEFVPGYLDSNDWTKYFFGQLYERVAKLEGTRYVFVMGLLSQTRGAGRPPPLVTLQSKDSFLEAVCTAPEQVTPTQEKLVLAALDKVLKDLPQEAFTGLSTKARITVSTSASWEKTRKEGGTAEAIREVLESYSVDSPVPIRDLDTGNIVGSKGPWGFDTVGEFVFWASLDYILRTPPEYLRYLFLTVVQEPGKARTVTKGMACLKIVLDLVNKICSWPLKKGIESSTSGMGRSHHAWNFFIRMMSDEMKDDLFRVRERQEEVFEGYVERTDTFEDFYVSSTDYKEATDRMSLRFAKTAGNAWMVKCGVPPFLRGVVNMVCYAPRTIVFAGTDGLSRHGEPSTLGENLREAKMVRGIPMGDPLTKVVLHLANICIRTIGEGLQTADFYNRFGNRNAAIGAYERGLGKVLP